MSVELVFETFGSCTGYRWVVRSEGKQVGFITGTFQRDGLPIYSCYCLKPGAKFSYSACDYVGMSGFLDEARDHLVGVSSGRNR